MNAVLLFMITTVNDSLLCHYYENVGPDYIERCVYGLIVTSDISVSPL